MDNKVTPNELLGQLLGDLTLLKELKDHASTGDEARHYAITITELEKVIAFFDVWVVRGAAHAFVTGAP